MTTTNENNPAPSPSDIERGLIAEIERSWRRHERATAEREAGRAAYDGGQCPPDKSPAFVAGWGEGAQADCPPDWTFQ